MTAVLAYLIPDSHDNQDGGGGLIGTSRTWMNGLSDHASMRRRAWTACPPRMVSVGATSPT